MSNGFKVLGAISSRFGSKFLAAAQRASRGARGSRSRSPLGLGRGETGNLGMCLGVDSDGPDGLFGLIFSLFPMTTVVLHSLDVKVSVLV